MHLYRFCCQEKFWDGKTLKLTPAYDLCPQMRVGQIATQAMALNGISGSYSTLINVLSISESFQIPSETARNLIEKMISGIKENWTKVCEEADMQSKERERLWGSVIFNPYCFEDGK
jgi:serine/threonine-protein kinase HipA